MLTIELPQRTWFCKRGTTSEGMVVRLTFGRALVSNVVSTAEGIGGLACRDKLLEYGTKAAQMAQHGKENKVLAKAYCE